MRQPTCHVLAAGLLLFASFSPAPAEQRPSAEAVLNTCADIARAGYEDSLTTARALDAARAAWVAARAPYQQTEVYRFGNAIVDDWEGRVNAWPLDEGLINHVDASYGTDSDENDLYAVNVIANPQLVVNGREVDASSITPTLLAETLHEAEGVEANVASGYHAIEFLLRGQDLNGTEAGQGMRPATDFDPGIRNVYGGHYRRVDGSTVAGPAIADLVAAAEPALDVELRSALDTTVRAMAAMRSRAESIEAYGQMIGEGNTHGSAVVQAAIDALVAQTRSIERAVAALDLGSIEIEGSDSLDNPNAVFQQAVQSGRGSRSGTERCFRFRAARCPSRNR